MLRFLDIQGIKLNFLALKKITVLCIFKLMANDLTNRICKKMLSSNNVQRQNEKKCVFHES